MPDLARRRLLLASSSATALCLPRSARAAIEEAPLSLGGEGVAPYSFLDAERQPAGLHWELCREALARMKLRMQWSPMPWRRALADLDGGLLDGVMGAARGNFNEREQQMAFPEEPLSWTHSVFVSLQSQPVRFEGLFSLRGLRVAVLAGYGYSPDFSAAKYFERQPAANHEQSLRMLVARRVQVALMDVAAARFLVQRDGLAQQLHLDPTPMALGRLYLGFSRQRTQAHLAEPFAEALREVKRTGGFAAMLARYGLRRQDVEAPQ